MEFYERYLEDKGYQRLIHNRDYEALFQQLRDDRVESLIILSEISIKIIIAELKKKAST